MRLIAAALLFAATLAAQNCTFTVSPLTFDVPAAASSTDYKVTVTVSPANCNQGWFATSSVAWLHITVANNNGTGSASFSVDQNITGFARRGTLSIANTTVTVTQAAANCTYTLTPKTQNFTVTGGSGTFAVQANCAWFAQVNTPDIVSVPNNTGALGDGPVPFTVASNPCVAPRTGSITVQTGLATPPTFTIPQDGSLSNFSLSASSASAGPAASDGRFTLTTGAPCGWSASSDVTWMQITSGASGVGSGAVAYHLIANATAVRTGTIHVITSATTQLTYTVTQQASGPPAPVLTSVNNAANYATGSVSPGEIVTLFGTLMGPSPLVPLQVIGGALTTNLAGTQVLFDGVPAPMIYSSATQLSAIAPYGIAGRDSTQVQVRYNGVVSNTLTIPVQPTTPAIFSLDSSGLGPGAILNQDYSINGAVLPAARGSVVAIYSTGGGATDPVPGDGAIIGVPPPQVTQTVSVTIGGADARIIYKGGVPGSIAGLTQINAEVPAGSITGSAVPILVTIGGVASTGGVTIAVR
jgi:uncharacterized protein (TIGR03437 family)